MDSLAVMAKSGRSEKKSNPRNIEIEVIPTNDQPPRIAVNNPLHVWTGRCHFSQSEASLHCWVIPTNDQPPSIAVNNTLHVWTVSDSNQSDALLHRWVILTNEQLLYIAE